MGDLRRRSSPPDMASYRYSIAEDYGKVIDFETSDALRPIRLMSLVPVAMLSALIVGVGQKINDLFETPEKFWGRVMGKTGKR